MDVIPKEAGTVVGHQSLRDMKTRIHKDTYSPERNLLGIKFAE